MFTLPEELWGIFLKSRDLLKRLDGFVGRVAKRLVEEKVQK
jgi:hypothetical protein